MILSVNNIHKSFAETTILNDVSFHIEDYEKAAIVGINGAGKSTLLKIIVGELESDAGSVILAKDKTIGYLAQHQTVSGHNTIYDELLLVKRELIDLESQLRDTEIKMKNADENELALLMETYSKLTHAFEAGGGYAYKSELTGVLKGLGFEENEFSKSIETLSGGQKTRVALGKLLLQKPDLIILDEPTNHLDMSSITWLETYLLNYKGAVIIVSHDRYFLDRIAGKIIELDNAKAVSFIGNYSAYAAKKEILRTAQYNAYMNQQREIKHQEEVIEKLKSFNREKSIKRAESREKMLNQIEVLDKPSQIKADMNLKLEPRTISGNDVLHVENIAKSFDNITLFENLSFDIKRGEHVAIIGDNGTGKTTILKIINELLSPDKGLLKFGSNVEIGYYDQEHHVLHSEKTLFDEISDEYPTLTNTQIRNTLAAFLFTGDDVFKKIETLSGGERGRLSLAKLMLSESNFLILDEPTNHLDIISKEILEDAINNYTGTILYVSHDRYFINKTASRILELENKKLTGYLGNYEYYLEKKAQSAAGLKSASDSAAMSDKTAFFPSPATGAKTDTKTVQQSTAAVTDPSGRQAWKSRKEEQAAIRKKENALKKCEENIEALEKRNKEIDETMALPDICSNVSKLQELMQEKTENEAKLANLYEQWEELSE